MSDVINGHAFTLLYFLNSDDSSTQAFNKPLPSLLPSTPPLPLSLSPLPTL